MTSIQNNNTLSIPINTRFIIHSSFKKCITFQLFIAIYYCILTFVSMNTQNTRVILYCLFFIANQLIKIINSHLDSIDPLGLSSARFLLQCIGWGCKVNMVYQLGVLAYLQEPLPVFIMFLHFIVANFRISRPDLIITYSKGRSLLKIMDFVNPILLYSFLKQFDSEQSDLSLIFLIFLCINLLFSSQLRLILTYQETDLIGWLSLNKGPQQNEQNEEKQQKWDRQRALKLLIIMCCVILVIENFLLSFQSIKNQICLNIIHTLIIGSTGFLISRNTNKF